MIEESTKVIFEVISRSDVTTSPDDRPKIPIDGGGVSDREGVNVIVTVSVSDESQLFW